MQLETYLESKNVPYERISHPPTYTAQGLAAEEHVPGQYVAKPVLVRTEDQFVLCVLPACYRLDLNRVARAAGATEADLATEQDMAEVFDDCELGAEPPFGNLFGLRTFVDESLKKDEYLLFQAGTHTEAIRMRRADYERVCSPIVAPIAHHL